MPKGGGGISQPNPANKRGKGGKGAKRGSRKAAAARVSGRRSAKRRTK